MHVLAVLADGDEALGATTVPAAPLTAGAPPAVLNARGETPLSLAAARGRDGEGGCANVVQRESPRWASTRRQC